ncbi:YbjQ family protein [Couchioplanes caeruleus]|uniref:UPF0145 protein BG844_27005 n=2 Tax=Couchioplanes caeruleus TaxID=56438 RepID=A0A1K0G201_9ACTN|nr:YbjQ family protein [Couchioplanes caeruleus]OJF11322.1 hypothetical protein BG844_27005 [Couchioplanes caeruleus subsp. caeruleus]ROP28701.1 uncharacterized protein YbjQ (UPF0145 family) [Couchioplanes caeruleus]
MLIVSSNDIPGYEIQAVLGEVFGVTVRSRNMGTGISAGFRALSGGEIPEMTQLMLQSRNEAMGRMIHAAKSHGANAIVAYRFDSGELASNWIEICAYGTAVWIVPVSEYAKRQHEALARAGRLPHQHQYATNVDEHGPPATH